MSNSDSQQKDGFKLTLEDLEELEKQIDEALDDSNQSKTETDNE